jgi:REP element-mobilizing transposase RayT
MGQATPTLHVQQRGVPTKPALPVHFLVNTDRRDGLSQLAIQDPAKIFAMVSNDFNSELTACESDDDHVHLLVVYSPKVAVLKLVNFLQEFSLPSLVAPVEAGSTSTLSKRRPLVAVLPYRLMGCNAPVCYGRIRPQPKTKGRAPSST